MPIPKGFEQRFSEHEKRTVRESVATMTSIVPIDYTASDNVSNDIVTINATTPPTMNLVTNPSFEAAGTPSWTATSANSALSRQTSQNRTTGGAASMQCAITSAASGDGAYYDLGATVPGSYAFSAYFRRASGSGSTVHVRASLDSGVTFRDGTTVTLSTAWQRSTLIVTVKGQPVDSLRIYVTTAASHAQNFFVDDVQVEPAWGVVMGYENGRDINSPTASVTSFVDIAGNRFSRFLGTANASVSIREPEVEEIHQFNLTVITADAYIDFDRDASRGAGSTAKSILVKAGDTISGKKITKQRISLINATDGQAPRVYGFVMGF